MQYREKLITLLFLTVFSTVAIAGSIHDLILPDLQHEAPVALGDYQGKVVLLSFFEPDCRWCRRQMIAFNQLTRHCGPELQPLAVGVHGNRQQLRHELRKVKASYPGLEATSELLQSIGEVPATPWTLVFDEYGKPVVTLRGYVQYKQLFEAFRPMCDL